MVLAAIIAFLGLCFFILFMHGRCEEREHTRKIDIGSMKMQRSQIEHKNWVEKAQLHLDYYDKQHQRIDDYEFQKDADDLDFNSCFYCVNKLISRA